MSAETDREQTKPPSAVGFLLPSLAALNRGSTVVHAAHMREVPLPKHVGGGSLPYPDSTSLCGVHGWGEGTGPVTCKRCLAAMTRMGVAA